MRALLVALAFLTRLPLPRLDMDARDFAGAVRMYPAAGVAVGAAVASAGWAGAQLDPWLGALAALVAWVWITGALHLDGLADLADGLGAAHGDRTRLMAVMRDPHVGSFGVVVLVLHLVAKLVLLHLLLPQGWAALIAIPAAARLAPLLWARMLPPLRAEGLGAQIADAARGRDIIGWLALLAATSVLLPALLAMLPIVLKLGWWFRRRLGGVSGDVHGAGIELTEVALLLAFAVQAAS